MAYVLGIDVGTSGAKAMLVSAEGNVVGQALESYGIDRPRLGWAEQDPESWWQAVGRTVRMALQQAGPDAQVSAIGLSGQMHGTVLVGEQGAVIAQAIIWPDQRSTEQVRQITELVGLAPLTKMTGSPACVGFQAASLLWLQQERPDLWQRTAHVLLPKDYIRWRMTGKLCTDPSDACGTLLFDIQQRAWSDDMLRTLDIPESRLPPIRPSASIGGYLTSDAADALGLLAGTPVVTGAADTACSALGAGLVGPESVLLTISTGGQIVWPAATARVDERGRVHTFCSALEPTAETAGWYQMAGLLAAGLALRWLRDQVFALPETGAYGEMTSWADSVPPGANGLLFLPYLIGERTPHMDPQARGMFLGLTAGHGRGDLTRAVMEGVALACYDAFSVLSELGAQPEHIVMAGGGARSLTWQQIIADVFGLPVRRLLVEDQSVVGAVLLAGAAAEKWNPAAIGRSWARYAPAIEPSPRRHDLYQDLLAIFRRTYQVHCEDFQALQRLADAGAGLAA